MNNERDEYFKQLQDRLNNSLDELSDTSVDNSLQEDNTRDPQEEYLKLIDAYNEKLNAPEKKLGWEDYIGDAAAAAHNILNYTQGNVMPNIEVGSVKAANKRISDEKNKSISGLQDLQGMYQKYMDMQRRKDQDKLGKERFNWEKTRAEKQDELRQKQYTDKEQERQLSNQLMQKKLDQYGQLTPYQQKMIEQQQLERELKKELAQKKDKKGKDIYKLGDELVRVGDEGVESLYKAEKDSKKEQKELTVGQKAVDKQFAKQYSDYLLGGGGKQVKADINSLEKVLKDFQKNKDMFTGLLDKGVEYLGGFDTARSLVNPRLQDLKSRLEQIIQQDLRQTLGAQFTEKEGKNFLERSFDPKLSAEANIGRLQDFIKKVKSRHEQIEHAGNYFSKNNGSMAGYEPMKDSPAEIEKIRVNINGKVGTVPKDKLESLLQKYPDAQVLD